MATISAIGNVMIPEMLKRGYSRAYAAAVVASSCFLGILIPPSVPGILFGLCAGVNISDIWLCTVGPGILIGVLYCVANYFIRKRHEKQSPEPFVASKYIANVVSSTQNAIGALLMPIIIFGGIYGGIFTPTEAGAVAAVYGLVYFVLKIIFKIGKIEISLWKLTIDSAVSTAAISMLLVFSNTAGRVVSLIGVSDVLAGFVIENFHSTGIFLLILNIIFLFLGMIIDINGAVMIMVPLLMPSVHALGIDPVHFGGIVLVNLSIGFITPPFAISIFVACKIANAPFGAVVKECIPYILIGLVAIVITTYVPPIALFLPSLL
jgi:C4-dicarboxylate transporter DctM subunit